jgi:hypothetical protein
VESTGLAGLFERIFNRLDTRHKSEIIESMNPKTGEKQIGYFKPDGLFQGLWVGEAMAKFPSVTVYDTESLVAYLDRYGSLAIESQRSVLYVNQNGLVGVIDYGIESASERRSHQVTFPAAWDEECRPAADLIIKATGRWIGFEAFTELLDKCAPVLANFAALESATSSIEGHESAKISRTARSYQVQVTGEVACAVEIPKVVAVQLMFMGQPVSAELPLRLTVKDKQVQFYLIDDGAITAAKARILTSIKQSVAERFAGLLVIEGTI